MRRVMLMPAISRKTCILRGVQHRCPRCGKGALYQRYLRPVAHCAACGTSLGHIRADDFPPWLTIILVGHLLVPCALASAYLDIPAAWQLVFWLPFTLGATLLLLPRCKGAIIGLMWALEKE
jgi:uncharacterized protein (DUF983 family)